MSSKSLKKIKRNYLNTLASVDNVSSFESKIIPNETLFEIKEELGKINGLTESEADIIVKRLLSDSSTFRLRYELDKLKEKQIRISVELEAVKRYVRWRQTLFLVRFVVIAIPVILGILFLPGYLKNLVSSLPDKFFIN